MLGKPPFFILIFLALIILGGSCKPPKALSYSGPIEKESSEYERAGSELSLKKRSRWIKDQQADIKHMDLHVSFDYEQEKVFGNAQIYFEPYFSALEFIDLDAKYFEIHECLLNGHPVEYEYDSLVLRVYFPKFHKDEGLKELTVRYTGRPALARKRGGSEWDGLYFVKTKYGDEIWSQNETEFASTWFPTIEDTRQRFTHDIFMEVDSGMVSVSNGLLVSSMRDSTGAGIDHWKMDQAHPAYLVMIAAGYFAEHELEHKGIPLRFMLDPEYEESIIPLFQNTGPMMDFLGEKLDYEYPWKKYTQIVVHDFVTGAMENTSASVFHDGLNIDLKGLRDEYHDDIIVHELAHQWFGDLVTCENWGSVALNEGFATYSEYLWYEHQFGREEADFHGYNEVLDYINESQVKQRPIIWNEYADPNRDMFDSHSYAKASRVIHMLRWELGDDAFFKSLSHYLKENAFSDVNIHDLRKSFEVVSGRDLDIFFNQWFMREGHPVLETRIESMGTDTLLFQIEQMQEEGLPFVFDLDIDLYFKDTVITALMAFDAWEEELMVIGYGQLLGYCLDPKMKLIIEQKPAPELSYNLVALERVTNPAKKYHLGYDVFDSLSNDQKLEIGSALFQEKEWYLKNLGLDYYGAVFDEVEYSKEQIEALKRIGRDSPKPLNRAQAIELLPSKGENEDYFKRAVRDTSWFVNSIGVLQMMEYKKDPFLSPDRLDVFKGSNDQNMIYAMASYLTGFFPGTNYSWYREKSEVIGSWDKYWFYDFVCQDVENGPEESADRSLEWLGELAMNSDENLRFFLLARLEEMELEKAGEVFQQCISAPQNSEYQSYMESRKKRGK